VKPPRRPEGGDEPSRGAPRNGAGTASADALDRLLDEVERAPWAYDYFALLRRVEACCPELPRLGRARRPRQEPLRLAQEPELDFAPAALARLDRRAGAPRLGVRFLGLLGPQGPMPLHLTEYVRERLRQHGDAAPMRFLDVFHHRMLLLFYRTWAQSQPVVQADRPGEDRYAAWIESLAGLGVAAGAAVEASAVPAAALRFQAGFVGARSAHAERLEKAVGHYFGVGARVQPFVPGVLELPREACSRLGHARNRPERARQPPSRLGVSANAGSRVPDRQHRFRLHLGPLTLPHYESFLPGGDAWPALQQWVRLLAGTDKAWDLCLHLRGDELPALRLGARVRLGLTSWLGRGDARERSDLRLVPHPSRRAAPPRGASDG